MYIPPIASQSNVRVKPKIEENRRGREGGREEGRNEGKHKLWTDLKSSMISLEPTGCWHSIATFSPYRAYGGFTADVSKPGGSLLLLTLLIRTNKQADRLGGRSFVVSYYIGRYSGRRDRNQKKKPYRNGLVAASRPHIFQAGHGGFSSLTPSPLMGPDVDKITPAVLCCTRKQNTDIPRYIFWNFNRESRRKLPTLGLENIPRDAWRISSFGLCYQTVLGRILHTKCTHTRSASGFRSRRRLSRKKTRIRTSVILIFHIWSSWALDSHPMETA
ncbi:hypothetical protein F4778DRAFT_758815 [Xylariomycetidae sp. FL2044]|nr:hypothetical protein F4778DRAFT_758815 [Xylariomycetidae sp. FL2044]